MKRLILPVALTIIFVVPSSYGATVYGYGSSSCGAWTQEREEQIRTGLIPLGLNGMLGWVMGYLTAMGIMVEEALPVEAHLKKTDSAAISAYIDNWCTENPLKTLGEAASSLIDELWVTEE